MTKKLQILTIEVMVLTSLIIQYLCWDANRISVKAEERYHSYDITEYFDDKTRTDLIDEIFSAETVKDQLSEVKAKLTQKEIIEEKVDKMKKDQEKHNDEYKKWKEEVWYNTPQYTLLGTYDLTAYCNCSICCGQWANVVGTASGTIPEEGRTVAINGVPFGTEIYIDGYGNYIVEDTGGMGYSVCDVFYSSHEKACQFGRKKGVNIYTISYPNKPEDD